MSYQYYYTYVGTTIYDNIDTVYKMSSQFYGSLIGFNLYEINRVNILIAKQLYVPIIKQFITTNYTNTCSFKVIEERKIFFI